MKDISTAFIAHLQTRDQTTAWLVKLTRRDDTVYAFTNHDKDIIFGTVTYSASDGITPTAFWTEENLRTDNAEIKGAISATGFTRADLLAGLFDAAEIAVYLVNWKDPDNQYAIIRTGFLGNIKLSDNSFTAEVLGITQYFQNEIVELCSPTCRAKLGDRRCLVDLNFFTQHGKITGINSVLTRRKIAADIFARQWVNSSDATDVLGGVYRWHDTTITGSWQMSATGDKLIGSNNDFADFPEGVEAVISGFAKGNNNRTFYVHDKGTSDEYLELQGAVIEIYADRTEKIHGGGITFDSGTKRINLAESLKYSLGFIPAGATFTISGSTSNNGTFTCSAADTAGLYIETSEALVDETCAASDVLTFKVIPRAVASTKRYYGAVGQYNEMPANAQVTVTGWDSAGNNGTVNVTAVAADGNYITVAESLTDETKDSDEILFTVPLVVTENPGTTITVEAFPGSSYGIYHNTSGTANWLVADNHYFQDGKLTFVSGQNDGLSIEIQYYGLDTWAVLGSVPTFVFVQNVPYDLAIGDEFYVTAGCDKSIETCYSKFANADNFQGEPRVPGDDKVKQRLA